MAADPRQLTLEWRKAERGARIYVDVNRINYAQHAVAPYARAAAPTALRWRCRSTGMSCPTRRLEPDRWTVKTIGARIEAEGDPWKGMGRHARALPRR